MKWQGKGVSEGLAMAQIHLFTPKLPSMGKGKAPGPETWITLYPYGASKVRMTVLPTLKEE